VEVCLWTAPGVPPVAVMSLSWPVSGSNSWVVTTPLPAVLIGQVQLGDPGIGRSVDLRCDALGLMLPMAF